jgi:ankyrin repeat protein
MKKKIIIRAKTTNRNLKIPLKSFETYINDTVGIYSTKDVEFLSAVSLGLKNRVKQIITEGEHNLYIRDKSGSNAVHIAAKKNDPELLRMICEKGVPASIRRKGNKALTPFLISAKHGCKDSLVYLHTEAKVDIHTKDTEGQNAVHYAAMGGDIDCFIYLVKTAKVGYKACNTVNGNTVLHTAAYYGRLAIVRYCCEVLKLDPHQFNYQGKSTLRFAIEGNSINTVLYLISVWNVSVFLPDDRSVTPIAYAASYKQLYKIFEFLTSIVSPESLVEGDLLLTRSLAFPPLTPLKAAFKHKNALAIDLIQKKTETRRKQYLIWISKNSPLMKKMKEHIIQNILMYA